jgi:hypothetical protein
MRSSGLPDTHRLARGILIAANHSEWGCLLYMAGVCLFRDERFRGTVYQGLSVRTLETLVRARATTNERVDGIRRDYCESAAVF